MKKLQKLFAMLLVLVMALSMAVPAFAADETGSITITDAEVGQTYTIYQVAKLISSSGTNYSYQLVDMAWEPILEKYGIIVDEKGYLTYSAAASMDATTTAAFAQELVAFGKENAETLTGTVESAKATANTVVFSDIPLGYYAVDSTLGTVCMLDNANPDVSIDEKNGVPVIEKYVKENSSGDWEKQNDDYIGKVIEYQTEVTVVDGAINYIVTDKMSAGLTFESINAVFYLADGKTYTVDYSGATDNSTDAEWNAAMAEIFGEDWATDDISKEYTQDAYTFVIKLDDADLVTGTEIKIQYTATINENAEIGSAGNPNETTLLYGDDPLSKSNTDKTITYVWEAGVYKYTTSITAGDIPLAGAVFSVYDATCTTEQPYLYFVAVENTEIDTYMYVSPEKYAAMTDAEKAEVVTEITSGETGKFRLVGLDSGKFWLKEIKAPDGYNGLTSDVLLQISLSTGDYSAIDTALNYKVENAKESDYVGIVNHTGLILPSTGSTGTIIFVTVGSILVLGMGLLLVVKKRMAKVEFVK